MSKEQQRNDGLFGPHYHQTICLTGRERAYTIHNYEVNIHASPSASLDSSAPGSSKVQISTITNQNWELPDHPGNMVASNLNYVAYILEGRSGYVLRLIHQQTNNRTLLKGFTGPVLDVAFAHSSSNLLACVDQGGNLFIWDLDKNTAVSEAHSTLQLHSKRSPTPDHTHHRLSWCPYVPQEEGEEEEEDGWMLAVSHGSEVEVYSLGLLPPQASGCVVLNRGQVVSGRFTIPSPHEKPLLDLSLSPDGGVLATSSEDGHLKFWQVNWENTIPTTSLHDFSPHGGDPVSRLIFCDNHTSQDPLAQFWRFLITGSNSNTEVKLWCTVSWKCLQTFRFLPPQDSSDSATPNILLQLDVSASYLLATDTRRMTLYVFQLVTDGMTGQASLVSITEYLLTQPILSFDISGHTPCPATNEGGDSGEEGEGKEVLLGGLGLDRRLKTVVIKLYCVHTRSMQELQVKFEPPDLLGIPPDPLPVPLFSGPMFSSEPTRPEQDKPVSDSDAVQNGEEEVVEREGEGEGEEGGEGEGEEVEEQIEEEEEDDDGPTPLEILGQPASLPSSFYPSSTSGPVASLTSPLADGFHSLPSRPGVSPKLVTPSAFLSATKIDISPSISATSSPSLSGTSPSSTLGKSPRPHPQVSLPSPFDTSVVSASSLNTLTSVTPSLEPSDATLDSHVLDDVLEGGEGGGDEGEGWKERDDDFEKEKFEELEAERGEGIGEGEEGGGGEEEGETGTGFQVDVVKENQASEVEEAQVGEPSDHQPPPSGGDDRGGEETTQEGVSDEFGLAQQLDQASGVEQVTRPAPVRPQQIFTSTEKSEFVTLSRKSLTPTREEGSEVVNTTGTPSAEFMEMFSQTPRRGSKVTTPQGGSEMASSYGPLLWVEKINVPDNAASAWPDDMPKLVSPGESNVGGPENTAPHTINSATSGGLPSEVSEVGQVGVRDIETGPSREEVGSGVANSYDQLFPSALGTPKLEPAFPVLRVSETTEGETGQTLPAASEQPTPDHDLLPSSVFVPVERVTEGEGGGRAEVAGWMGEEEVKMGTVEESTGATTPHLIEVHSSPPPPLITTSPLDPQLGGGAVSGVSGVPSVGGGGGGGSVVKTKGRRRRARSKPQAAVTVPATSDGEPSSGWEARGPLSENQLTPSPTPFTNDGVESVGVADHTHLMQLYQLVISQQKEIAALRVEQQRGFAALHQQLESVQRSTVAEQRSVLGDHAREHPYKEQKMDRVLKEKQVLDRQRQDKLISTVSQTLTSAVNMKLEKVVKTEMKSQVMPAVNRSLGGVQEQLSSSVQEQLSSSVQQRLTATDTALRDGISQILHSKGLPESVGAAVAGSIRNTIQGMYEETFRAVVLPAFERSSQEMFRQMDEAFRRGISEYLSQLQQQFHQLRDPSLQQLTSSYHSLHSLLTSPESPLLTSLQHEIRSATQSTVQGVGEGVRGVVREEVEAVMQSYASTVRLEDQAREKRAHTQEEIQRLLKSQDINRAFETALSTSDLSIVLFLCQQVAVDDVFDKMPCPLSQPVLLSLIQQFSVDLSDNVELKIRYLESSVLALDVTNDITRNHMIPMLKLLTQHLSSAEETHRAVPNSASLLRLIKRLRMITERLCHSQAT